MRATLLLVAAVATLTACTETPTEIVQSPTQTVNTPLFNEVEGPAEVEGEVGSGALYGLYLPADWNGDLVLYAHGYTSPDAPIALPAGAEADALRDALLDLGYGVAWSSYSENGYAVKEGVRQTRQLRRLFATNFGWPKRTYLMGHSLGGLITLSLAEKHPRLFDGALPLCGPIGGGALEVDYIYDARVLFDYFYPGVLPGDALNVPEGLDFGADVVPAVFAAVSGNPAPAFQMAAVDQIELPFTTPGELINSILSALFFSTVGTADFFDRIGGDFFENSTTVYSGSLDDDALNAGVDRFQRTRRAGRYFKRWYQPRGKLKIPVLTVHTSMDPIVPLFHEPAYEAIAASAGRSDYLVQRTVDRYGHCTFTGPETITAFLDLVNWVEDGVVPTP
ncbi:MAG: hypothetical protein ACR2QM_20735 [Longimicrobiales bacterium]